MYAKTRKNQDVQHHNVYNHKAPEYIARPQLGGCALLVVLSAVAAGIWMVIASAI